MTLSDATFNHNQGKSVNNKVPYYTFKFLFLLSLSLIRRVTIRAVNPSMAPPKIVTIQVKGGLGTIIIETNPQESASTTATNHIKGMLDFIDDPPSFAYWINVICTTARGSVHTHIDSLYTKHYRTGIEGMQ